MQIIYLSNDDTVDVIAGKIKASQEKEINLVVLSRTIPVLSVVNLKMFKKIAENLNKIISVSTADEAVKILVENSGMSLRVAEKKDDTAEVGIKHNTGVRGFAGKPRSVDSISISKGPIDLSSRYELPKKPAPEFLQESLPSKPIKNNNFEEIEEIETFEEEPTKFQVPRTSRNIFIGFIMLVIVAVGIAAYILLPTAKIVIAPKANPINSGFDFIIGTNIKELNIEEKKIPAVVIGTTIEKEGQFTATGKKQIVSNATGIVTMYNEWSSIPQKLLENTRLSTTDGKVFRTTTSVTIPAFVRDDTGSDVPGKIEVPIIASEPGPEYNIDPTDFSIVGFKGTAKYTKIYAKSQTATSGGASGFTTVISADDFKRAKVSLEEEARKDVVSQLNDKKPSDLIMIEQAISIKSGELVSPLSIDQPTSKFKASLKITAAAFLFNPNDVKAIAKSDLENKNEENKNFVIVDAGLDYGDAVIIGTDTVKLSAQSHANKFNLIDENDLRAKIVGKSREELETYVKNNYPDINKISVTLWPFWVTKIPSIEKNVTISLDIPHGE
jgi:hypothetical protein